MANKGNVKVVGSAEVKNHKNNTDDNCNLIITIRNGVSSGHEGLFFFFCEGKECGI